MKAVRTPDERFTDLPDFPFEPHYRDDLVGYEGLRVHYVDEGAADQPVFLCLHGEPTWSYLYRKMIPIFVAAPGRVVAPDFLGFGRSDKPTDDATYTYDFHRGMILRFVEALDLRNITLVAQDWGGILGLTLPMEMPDRFERLIVMNTALPTGRIPLTDGFHAWKAFARSQPNIDVGRLMIRAVEGLSPAEAAAYDAPFVDPTFKAGVRRFPELVPVTEDMEGADVSRRALRFWKEQWSGPSFMAIGHQDPVLGASVMHALHAKIRGCPAPLELTDVGHFVPEAGEQVAKAALASFAATVP